MKCTLNLSELAEALWLDLEVPTNVIEYLNRRLLNEGIGFLTHTLQTMGHAVLRGVTNRKFVCPKGWATQGKEGALPKQLCEGWLDRVFTYYGGLVDDVNSVDVYAIYQALCYFSKLVPEPSENLEVKTAASFLERNETVPDVKLGAIGVGRDILIALQARSTMPSWFSALCAYRAEHSSGAVSDLDLYGPDGQPLDYYVYRGTDVSYGVIPAMWKYRDYLGVLPGTSFDIQHKTEKDNYPGVYASVPKKAGVRRTIIKDGLARNRNVRAGVFAMRDWFEYVTLATKKGNLCGVRFRSQAENQALAGLASIMYAKRMIHGDSADQATSKDSNKDNEWCTLDLTAASDSVSRNTAICLMGGLGSEILDTLLHTRASKVVFPNDPKLRRIAGKSVEMRINAGMGDQGCFLMESIVFYCAGAFGLVESGGYSILQAIELMDTGWAQFGDDIICKKSLLPHILYGLTTYGLRVNTQKSFTNGGIAESCGYYGIFGVTTKFAQIKCSGRTYLGKHGLQLKLTADFDGKANADPEILRAERHCRELKKHGLNLLCETLYEQLICLGYNTRRDKFGRIWFDLPQVHENSGGLGRVTPLHDYQCDVDLSKRDGEVPYTVTTSQLKVGEGYSAYPLIRVKHSLIKDVLGARVGLRRALTPSEGTSVVNNHVDIPHTVRLQKRRVSVERAFGVPSAKTAWC